MARTLTVAVRDELAATHCRPRFLLEVEATATTLRYWTGARDVTWNGHVWLASSLFKTVDQVSVQKGIPEGMTINLAGEPSEMIALIQNGFTQNKAGRFYLGFVDDNLALIPDPVLLFQGRLDTIEVIDDLREATVTLVFANELARLTEENQLRYTHETQQLFYSGDRSFEYLPQLEDLQLYWGVPDAKKGRKKKGKIPRAERKARRGGKR